MSDPEQRNNKRPKGKRDGRTRSFDGSTPGPGSHIGPFRIEHELGRGAAGIVYLAHDTKLNSSVAMKSLPAELMENPKARKRFAREIRVLASLNHPNIATIYDEFEEAEGVGYQPVWSRHGKKLFYRCGEKMIAATFETEPEFRITNSKVLFEGKYLTGWWLNYDVSEDGQRFLMIQESEEQLASTQLIVILNWFEELKRLVPEG